MKHDGDKCILHATLFHASALGLQSAMRSFHGREPVCTHCTTDFTGCLDYVFYSPVALQVLAAQPDKHGVDIQRKPMPNCEEPSDHVPLAVDFGYTALWQE